MRARRATRTTGCPASTQATASSTRAAARARAPRAVRHDTPEHLADRARGGLRALTLILVASAVAPVMSCHRDPGADESEAPPPPSQSTSSDEAERRATGVPEPGRIELHDITATSGVDFHHTHGGTGSKLLPETLGAGGAFLDFDRDGILDIFLVDSTTWELAFRPPRISDDAEEPRCRLYRGLGDGRFRDVTTETGAGVVLYGMGCAVADFDGDHDTDIYVTAVGDNVLLRNDGARFHDVTVEAGVAGGRWRDKEGLLHPEWSTAAAWLDADLDGRLDLLVANYVEWTPSHEIFTSLDGVRKAFTTPERYTGLPARLFRNRGDGSFEDVSEEAGLSRERGKALGIALWDLEGNGLPDIVVANDTRPNFLFENLGGGRFRERGLEAGIAYDQNGRARAGMGVDIADPEADGRPAVVIGNFAGEPVSLYRWVAGSSVFRPEAASLGIARPTHAPLAFGVIWADMDLDGRLDLIIVNGHIEPDIARTSASETHAQPAQLFLGAEGGRLEDYSAVAGEDFARPRVARGLAAGDIDGDGDLDLLITVNGGAACLLRNDPSGGGRHLRVRLVGRSPRTDAIGATVRLTTSEGAQVRMVRSGSSYLTESERTLTFGLGPTAEIRALEVRWPDGEIQTLRGPIAANRLLVIEQGSGAARD